MTEIVNEIKSNLPKFTTDIIGKIDNLKLSSSKHSLLPLYEAVTNSYHSLDESSNTNKYIEILIERDSSQTKIEGVEGFLKPIKSIEIIDNGVGFNDKHFNSFLTSDSTLKKNKGGKGLGRFSYLKAFEYVEIKSIYEEDGKFYERKFLFKKTENGIEEHNKTEVREQELKTSVKLVSFNKEFKIKSVKGLESIARRIINHNLLLFMENKFPNTCIRDLDSGDSYKLSDIWKKDFSDTKHENSFKIGENDLKVLSIHLNSNAEETDHKISLCANDRSVTVSNLSRFIPNLSVRLVKDNKSFVIYSCVVGKILDENVNQDRTGFILDKNIEDGEIDFGEITQHQIILKACELIENHIKNYINEIQDRKIQKIRKYVENEAPQYRILLSYPRELEKVPANVSDDTLDIELHKVKNIIERRLKQEGKDFLKIIKNKENIDLYKEQFSRWLEEENQLGKSNLGGYIVHRKIILELLERSLELNEQSKYALESTVHELIFPLKKSSDDVNYESMNLWIIDEKLAYHNYLASDKKFSEYEKISLPSSKRPDLAIFQGAFSFTQDESEYNSVVIIEFKRPDRDDYSEAENPIVQVHDYIRDISQHQNARTNKGRPFEIKDNTPFYCYIICDITHKLRNICENYDYTEFASRNGYYSYNKKLNAYIEIISFNKLLNDAKKRNQILFDKLNIK